MLLLGGPLHGTERDIENGQTEVIIMAPSPGNPVPTPWKYVIRGVQAETKPGRVFERTILVEQSMPVEVATQALAAVLMQRFAEELVRQFMEGGELVVRNSDPETESGLIVAKR